MNIHEKQEAFQSISVLNRLPPEKLAQVARFLQPHRISSQEVIFEEGGVERKMYFIASGTVSIEKRAESNYFKQLAILHPGEFFGEISLLETKPRSARAVAQTNVLLFEIGYDDFFGWLRFDPDTVLGVIMEMLTVTLRRLQNTSEELVLLYDLGHLIVEKYDKPAPLLSAALRIILPRLPWKERGSGAVYLCSEFSDEILRVASEGIDLFPEALPAGARGDQWIDDKTYCATLPGLSAMPFGFLLVRGDRALEARYKSSLEISMQTGARLLASALWNINYSQEEMLRKRMDGQKML